MARRKDPALAERNTRIVERRMTTGDSLRRIAQDEDLSYERVRQILSENTPVDKPRVDTESNNG